ncbi:uncharacterized protein LOC113783593 [Coffea eugenioides]|uniref:uncharacterized protein LOC113783593 n=1 Tax=Coffea eugenioides TaxID=49369 RepID=UPI000F611685|nr:uncharacterized protein LOC113783593 [Coffea eugenioides]
MEFAYHSKFYALDMLVVAQEIGHIFILTCTPESILVANSDCSGDKKEPRVLDTSSNLETGKEMAMTCENSEADVVVPRGQRGITCSICSGKHGGGTLLDNMEVAALKRKGKRLED